MPIEPLEVEKTRHKYVDTVLAGTMADNESLLMTIVYAQSIYASNKRWTKSP